jgi:hypothetical protein
MQGSIEGQQCGARSQMAKNFIIVFDLKKTSKKQNESSIEHD